ncbi:hypothetical protein BC834DRAFT_949091 [Gloeopeniophorella convolvens]|nr:hypothetical protein BC834DRAFT_949091 [Gloeopeniophorella convolvens]
MSVHDDEPLVHELPPHDPTRPHSFDLTLELERQLEAESLPNSPAYPKGRPQSLDTHVLASLVTSLRMNVQELTKERDDLSAALDASRERESKLSAEVSQLKEADSDRDAELAALRQKVRDDEESIVLLRSKVEESRRGLMRLQTESRRVSRGDMSVDLSRAGSFSFGGPASAKRMSFTPLTGSSAGRMQNHRRISSVSDSNVNWSDIASGQPANTSPNSQIVTLPDAASPPLNHPPSSSHRFSGLFGRAAAPDSEPIPGFASLEKDKLEREIQALKAALEDARHDLTEASEARDASETCVKALRDFIAENNVGVPPVSVDIGSARSAVARSDDADKRSASGSGGSRWGFGGLFRAGENSSPVIPNRSASTTSSPPTAEPLARKLGGFFGSRGSFSSSTSAPPRGVPTVQEAMYNGSDSSSTAESTEPVSPTVDESHVPMARVLSGTSSSSELLAMRGATETTPIVGKSSDVVVV